MNKRVEFVDLAKGICISLVVLLHVFGDLSGTVIKIMNLFRMPLYFVLSGLFFKTYDGLFPFLKKKTNKLLIPFLFTFVLVIIPADLLLHLKEGSDITFNNLFWGRFGKLNLGINGAAWFLLCLFFVNVYFYLIFLVTRKSIVGISVLSCACGIVGYLMGSLRYWLPLWLDSSLTALPFFLMGYVMRNYGNILYEALSKKHIMTFTLSLLLLLVVYYVDERLGTGVIIYGDSPRTSPWLPWLP